MDKELRKALADLGAAADPARTEKAVRKRIAEEEVPAETRRYPGGYQRPLRAVLAAAVALVLAGSVYAAVQKFLTVTLPEDGPYDVVVQMPEEAGEMIVLPAEKRKELQAHVLTQEDILEGKTEEKQKRFDTWAEAAAWLDCGLLTSDALTETQQDWGNVRLRVNGAIYPTLGRATSLSLYGTVTGALLEKTGWQRGYGSLTVTIPLSGEWENYGHTMIYRTDRIYDKDEPVVLDLNEHEKQSAGELVTRYTTASGIQAEIAVLTVPYAQTVYPDGRTPETKMRESTEVHIYFLHGGILYEFRFSAENAESGVEAAKAVMDSME